MLNDNNQRRKTKKPIFSSAKLKGETSTIKMKIVKLIDIRFRRVTRKVGKSCSMKNPIAGIVRINMKCRIVIKKLQPTLRLCEGLEFEIRLTSGNDDLERDY